MAALKLVPTRGGWPDDSLPDLSILIPVATGSGITLAGIINKRISRAQLSIKRQADGAVVAELLGTNPSLINDIKMEKGQQYRLKHGDIVKFLPDFAHFALSGVKELEMAEPPAPISKRKLTDSYGSTGDLSSSKKPKPENPPAAELIHQPDAVALARHNSLRILDEKEEKEAEALQSLEARSAKDLQKSGLAQVVEDVKKLQKVCHKVGFYCDDSTPLQCFVLRMALDTSFLDNYQLKALGAVAKKAIVVQLKFDWNYLEAADIPAIFTFQTSDDALDAPALKDYETEFGALQWYLETRITSILRKNWCSRPAAPADEKKAPPSPAKEEKAEGGSSKAAAPEASQVAELVKMGFARDQAERALTAAKHQLEEAVSLLLSGNLDKAAAKPAAVDPKVKTLMEMGFTETEAKNGLEMFGGDVKAVTDNLLDTVQDRISKEKDGSGKDSPKGKGKGKGKGKRPKDDGDDADDPLKLRPGENLWPAKGNSEGSFLVSFYKWLAEKFITCPTHCLICDADLNVALIKIPVCANADCQKVYQTTSCGQNSISNELKHNPEVVDFLLNLLAAVASGINVKGWNRGGLGLEGRGKMGKLGHKLYGAEKISFEPFPWHMGFDDGEAQDIGLLLDTLDSLPAIKEMQTYSSDEALKMYLDEISPLCFPLLRWTIQSNRTPLSFIPPRKQLKEMKTPLQFQVVNSFPEHEKKFLEWQERAKKENPSSPGSYKAFHGSPITNWHSIIRTGLRSGFVPGIYMAADAAVSLGYMAVGASKAHGWANSMWKHDEKISAISLLEVADMRHNSKLVTGGEEAENGGVNVAMENTLVVTRFIFFYPKGPDFAKSGWFGGGGAVGPRACKLATDGFMFRSDSADSV